MKNLSLAEQYTLCILNDKENRSVLYSNEYAVCILASSLWELISYKAIKQDENKKLVVNGEFNNTKNYLKYIYDDIALKKSRDVNEVVEDYVFHVSGNNLKNIINSLVDDLIERGYIKIEKQDGLFKERTVYLSNENVINDIMKKIREDVLEEQNINTETMILVSMLFWTKSYKEYFSKYETKQLKVKLEKIKETNEYLFIKKILDDIQSILLSIVISSKSMG
ncbi:MAG: GPP34 family phosphoprotein [Clostridium perfringens]|nr:GPP34 family phosphoprotein [Clostridium perfringens]